MNVKNFFLSFYKNAMKDFYIKQMQDPTEAQKLHAHNYFQIYFVLQGRLIHHIKDGQAELNPGDAFILPPNVPHYIEIAENGVNFFALSFLPEFLLPNENKMVTDFLQTLTTSPIEKILPRLVLPHRDILFAESMLQRIDFEFQSKNTGKETMIQASVLVLLTLFARIYFEEHAESITLELKKQTALHCMEYVENHFDEDLTLDEISRRFAMSRTAFCNVFSSVAGTSFREFLNQVRIQKACELLKSGEKASITAEKCGFADFSTFHRNFKKIMGLSPTQYRLAHARSKESPPFLSSDR